MRIADCSRVLRRWLSLVLSLALAAFSAIAHGAELKPFPANPEIDVTYPIRQEAANRGTRLTVFNGARSASYGALHAKAGRSLLILNTEWENIIPLMLAGELKLATTY